MTNKFTVEEVTGTCHKIRVPYSGSKDWEQWFLLSSDRHHDNPKTRQDLEQEHLKEAKERNAGVIDIGDLFCAMQGKYDRRASKD